MPVVTATAVAEGSWSGFERRRARPGRRRAHRDDAAWSRPRGKRFGTLVHAILAEVELDAEAAGVALVAAAQGRILGASADEIEAGSPPRRPRCCHPIMRRAAASISAASAGERPRSCSPRGGRHGDRGRDRSGVPRAAPTGPEWTVVDFKTDVELSERKAQNTTQILLYVKAIRAATGEPAKGVLLSV